jgi:hypothetical protein
VVLDNHSLSQEIKDDLEAKPLEMAWGAYGDYRLVGNGKITNGYCGNFARFKGCLRVDLHNLITLDGINSAGKVFVRRVRFSCGKPSCPICYKSGWAVREAENIKHRLVEASKMFGNVEHLVCSVPTKDYGLKLKALRRKVIKMLTKIGVVGGVLIFHAFRYNRRKGWYWSPHFHVMGFILGGYSKCRHCKGADCYACNGFEGKTYRLFHDNDYIVKVFDERITIFGTAWYQLNHSSYKAGVKRFHIATWYGSCSYRKLKVTAEMRKEVCPICQHDLVEILYFGNKRLSLNEERDSFENYVEDNHVVFAEKVKGVG